MHCIFGDTDVVQLLLNNSDRIIELNARNKNGWTALMLACNYGQWTQRYCPIAPQSFRQTIKLNARSDNGMTPLMWACNNGHKDIVKLLRECSEERDIDISGPDDLSKDMKDFIEP